MEHSSFNMKPVPALLSHSELLAAQELATLRRIVPVVLLPALLLMQPEGAQAQGLSHPKSRFNINNNNKYINK